MATKDQLPIELAIAAARDGAKLTETKTRWSGTVIDFCGAKPESFELLRKAEFSAAPCEHCESHWYKGGDQRPEPKPFVGCPATYCSGHSDSYGAVVVSVTKSLATVEIEIPSLREKKTARRKPDGTYRHTLYGSHSVRIEIGRARHYQDPSS